MAVGEFFDQFIEDYYSECDEHLATVRRILLTIDSASTPDGSALHDLARALHTLKGLSGMVGFADAEQIAHGMEEALRALAGAGDARENVLELLFTGTRLLDSTIANHRAHVPTHSSAAFMTDVQRVIGDRAAVPGPNSVARGSGASLVTVDRSRATCRFEFVPSGELAGRGVGVEVIRQRLKSIGDITMTAPRVRPSGGVAFEFTVSVRDGLAPRDEWKEDGLSWTWESENGTASIAATRIDSDRPDTIAAASPSNVVRVDLARLDDLMRLVGELVVTRSRLGDSLARVGGTAAGVAWDDVQEANERIERQLRTIREGVMRIRLVAVGEVFDRMRFATRDIAREAGKEIRLEISGQETEIDKLVVDRMLEPLLHLVRNSVSHGIESPAERQARGKPAAGTISLRARTAGDRIVLEVEDDGAGIDVERVARRAAAGGLIPPNAELFPDELLDVICTPGFSTRDSADMASGRGVGMAVARTTVRALGGELFVQSVSGGGTRFTIELPLTLMITDALIVEIGDQPMAIPQIALREIVPLELPAVTRFESNDVLSYRGRVVPLVYLGELFSLPPRPNAPRHVLIVGSEAHSVGLVVDRLLGLREIVVHPVSDPLIAVPGVAGATELVDGRVSLILDAAALVRTSREPKSSNHRLRGALHNGASARLSEEHTWS